MDRRIRQVAGLVTVMFLVVAGAAGWIQGINAETIAANEPRAPSGEQARNQFRIYQECRWERGTILSADGQVLATSVPTPDGRLCLYERAYPSGELAPHVVGQWSLHFGKTGLESVYNAELFGDEVPASSIADLFQRRPREGNTLVSTIDTRLQQVALDALDGRRGGVVALNPRTGAVLVSASNPSYDPNLLASNSRRVAQEARCELGLGVERDPDGTERRDADGNTIACSNPNSPMLSVALQGRRPPGSTFKVVTAAAALESGEYTPDSPMYGGSSYVAPGELPQHAIGNYGGGSCGGNLSNALRASCNVSFADLAVELGADRLYATAQAMGLDASAGSGFSGCDGGSIADIRETRTGCLPMERHRFGADGEISDTETLDTPGFRARAGFGQWVLEVSPFGMATVAATVANGGFVPRPRFAERVINKRGETVREIRTGIGRAAMSPEGAGQLAQMMRTVVTSGTGARAFGGFPIPSAGKTGTADQTSCAPDEQAIFGEGCGNLAHAWYMAFAPADDPQIAIAVLVERGGGRSQATGGAVAAPVARQVLEAFFNLYPAAAGAHAPDPAPAPAPAPDPEPDPDPAPAAEQDGGDQ
jgi:penicillin-binding protein A